MKKFFIGLVKDGQAKSDQRQDESEARIAARIDQSECSMSKHISKQIDESQTRTSQHFQEQLVNSQAEITSNISDLRTETSSNHQSLYEGLTKLETKFQKSQSGMDDFKAELRQEEAAAQCEIPQQVLEAQAPVAARCDASEQRENELTDSVDTLRESVAEKTNENEKTF